jgi:sulfonate transport system ATP-binding protein
MNMPVVPIPEKTTHAGLKIDISCVSKYFGERQVLRNLDLHIEPGGFVAIVGRSGCGKSTLLRLLSGLETYESGEIRLDGTIENGIDPRVRMMFQDSRLLPWQTVIDNILLGLPASQTEAAVAALASVGLAGRENDWPRMLSGGQKQRVALARALVHRPRCLLLDEPLGALDALTRIEMQRLIERLWMEHRFTAVLVTHDVAEAVVMADRVVLMDEGRIVYEEHVPFPHPRRRDEPDLAAIEGRVLRRVLGDE